MVWSKSKRVGMGSFIVVLVLILCSACVAQTADTSDATKATKAAQTTRPAVLSAEQRYDAALAALDDKDYAAAYTLLTELGDYQDAAAYVAKFVFRPTEIRQGEERAEAHCTTFVYDEQGNCITITEDDDTQQVFTYDEIGFPVQQRVLVGDKQRSIVNYVYDENDLLVQEICNEGYGEYTFCYEYDDSRRVKKRTITFNDDDYPESEVLEFFYDEHGNCIETYGHYAVGDHVNEYTYDENGRCIRQIHAAGYGESIMEYDTHGNRVKQVLTPYYDEEANWITTYTYEPFYFEGGVPDGWQVFIDRFVYSMY